MGLNDNFLIIVCLFMPVIYCGKLTEFFLLQHRLLDFLRYRNTRLPSSTWMYDSTMSNNNNNNSYSLSVWKSSMLLYGHHANKPWTPTILDTRPTSSLIQPMSPVIYRHSANTSSTSPLTKYSHLQRKKVNKRYDSHLIKAKVELLLVVDNSIFRKFLPENNYDVEKTKEKIIQYYKVLFAVVNQRFENLADRIISVRVHICDIILAETRREAAWLEYMSLWSSGMNNCVIQASKALRRFQKWLRRKYDTLPQYDHAIVFTNCLLEKRRSEVEGLAYIGKMCKVRTGKSASIVHDSLDFQAAGVIAHEIGHSLGVTHDNDRENQDCPASNNNIMAPHFVSQNESVAANTFYFSTCSIRQMKRFLRSSQSGCLFNTPTERHSYDMNREPPGLIYDVNKQCQLSFGPSAYFCDHPNPALQANMCKRLYCSNPADPTAMCHRRLRLMALPGTPCAHKMYCHLGQCVYSERIMSPYHNKIFRDRIGTRTAHCPQRDTFPSYCRSVLRASPYMNPCVYKPMIKKNCCNSCKTKSITLW